MSASFYSQFQNDSQAAEAVVLDTVARLLESLAVSPVAAPTPAASFLATCAAHGVSLDSYAGQMLRRILAGRK